MSSNNHLSSHREHVTKKFVNRPESAVDDSLNGLVAINPNISLLEFDPRVVIRSDIEQFKKSNKIALIAGGGSGHEPVFGAYVGKGMLTAAVAGSVFASPTALNVLNAVKAVECEAGVIVFVINYTGDRLNFGMAVEQARLQYPDRRFEIIFLEDDIAVKSENDLAGRRGIAGVNLIVKMAGALAEQGARIEEIVSVANEALKNIATIGMSLSPCSLPGQPPNFTLKFDEMELGLGIHGEPGTERMQVKTAEQIIDIMMTKLTNHIALNNGESYAILVNNLGSTTDIEMNILTAEIFKFIGNSGVPDPLIQYLLIGRIMTALEMHGFSITLMRLLDRSWLELLNADTEAPGWPGHLAVKQSYYQLRSNLHVPVRPTNKILKEHQMNYEKWAHGDIFRAAIEAACDNLIDKQQCLNKLDRIGDGDCGETMASGAKGLKSADISYDCPSTALMSMGQVWQNEIGGTSGAIYGILLTKMSQHLSKNVTDVTQWLEALKEGMKAITQYGHAKAGDRTMLDSLHAIVEFVERPDNQLNLSNLDCLIQAVKEAASNTSKMVAKAGRASYVDKSKLTEPDAGAVAVSIWFEAICQTIANKH